MTLRENLSVLILMLVAVTIGSLFGAAILIYAFYKLLRYHRPRGENKRIETSSTTLRTSNMPLMSMSGYSWDKSSLGQESDSGFHKYSKADKYGSVQSAPSIVPDSPASLDTFQLDSTITDGSELVSPGEEIRFLHSPTIQPMEGDLGTIQLSSMFTNTNGLTVIVHSVENLPLKVFDATTDPYVRVQLIKDKLGQIPSFEFRTLTKKDTSSPIFEQSFNARIKYPDVQAYHLKCIVCDYNKYFDFDAIGEITISLDDIRETHDQRVTLPLSPSVPESRGDVLVSLAYLPTSKRLLVTVLQARGLNVPQSIENAETYARIILFAGNRKIRRKKTMASKSGKNVSFHERFYFDIPMEKLDKMKLMIVITSGKDSGYDSESGVGGPEVESGKVMIGRRCSTKAQAHWKEMFVHPRIQIAQWYTLHT